MKFNMTSLLSLSLIIISASITTYSVYAETTIIKTPDPTTCSDGYGFNSLNADMTFGCIPFSNSGEYAINNFHSTNILKTCDFIISVNSTGTFAQDCMTGTVTYSGTDSSQVIQSAINSGNTIIFKAGIYNISNSININKPNMVIQGQNSGSTILNAVGTSQIRVFNITNTGITGQIESLSSDSIEQTNIVTLPTSTGILFSDNDYVRITDKSQFVRNQVSQIVTVSGDTLYLADPLGDSYLVANQAQVQKIPLLSGIYLSGFTINGDGNTNAVSNGIYVLSVTDSYFSDLKIIGFNNAGFFMGLSYKNTIHDITLIENSKSGNESADFYIVSGSSNLSIRNIRSYDSGDGASGFGATFSKMHNSDLQDIVSQNAGGRGMKLHLSSYNTFNGIKVFNSGSTNTGLSITVDSHHNIFSNVITSGNNMGIAIFDGKSGANSRNNIFMGVIALKNTRFDLYNGNGGDIVSDNVMYGVNYVTSSNNGQSPLLIK